MNDASLLQWQWANYEGAHQSRRNLLMHVLTVPLFIGGTIACAAAAATSGWLALAGAIAMPLAIALQGRTHRGEQRTPAPFRGPWDVVLRIFAEQWITFPRFVLSGRFLRVWRRLG